QDERREQRREEDGEQVACRGPDRIEAPAFTPGERAQLVLVRLHERPDREDQEDQPEGPDLDVGDAGQDAVRELMEDDRDREAEDAVPEGYDRVDPGQAEE